MAHALHIDGLSKQYGSRRVLGPIDLQLAPGTITAVIGRSGCGKTTLLRCLAGLEQPTGGDFSIDGGRLRPGAIGTVFQEPRLLPWLRVSRNVGFGLREKRTAARAAAIADALRVVGLSEAGGLLPKQLSGGMAQRVSLARALAPAPALLLLDEPFSALDPFTRAQMQDHLLHLHRHYGTTMVLITHDMDEALRLADRIIVLHGPPGLVTGDLSPGLPKPCLATAPDFVAWKVRLTECLAGGEPAPASDSSCAVSTARPPSAAGAAPRHTR